MPLLQSVHTLLERQRQRNQEVGPELAIQEKEGERREIFTLPQTATTAKDGPGETTVWNSAHFTQVSHMCGSDPSIWPTLHSLPVNISKELDQNSQDSDRHSDAPTTNKG